MSSCQKKDASLQTQSRTPSFSRPNSCQKMLSLNGSLRRPVLDLNPFEEIEYAKSRKENQGDFKHWFTCFGLLLSDKAKITSTNRPTNTFFDWFLSRFGL
ncbi:hypothetical protein SOVF_209000 isoform B [Spinacia oleracea]|nr:hypothetical protein SOVF_209000 isoform B [Spinacia oleracea]